MIIRHAEKPIGGASFGVRISGKADPASLAPLGWQRAGALSSFFEQLAPRRDGILRPDHLFATRFDKYAVNASRRPLQTLEPLSKSMGTAIVDRYGKGQASKVVTEIQKLDGVVLVAWSHEEIPALVEAMGSSGSVPTQWPEDRFDLVWVFDRHRRGWKFMQVSQQLLAGDR